MDNLDFVALGIFHYEGVREHDRNYRNNNPGNLRIGVFMTGKDKDGYATFPTMAAGYLSLVGDLRSKFIGRNKHGLGPGSSLLQLMKVYAPEQDHNDPVSYGQWMCRWLTKCLGKPVTLATALGEIWTPGK